MLNPRIHGLRVLLIVSLGWLGGCARQAVVAPNPLEIDRSEYPRMYAAAVEVLREQGYIVDRQDYRYGTVSTRPRSSPSVFEVWYPDNSTGAQVAQSTVNSQRRVVTVSLEQASAAAQEAEPDLAAPADLVPDEPEASDDSVQPLAPEAYLLRIEVIVEQLEAPIHHMTGSTDGRRVIGRLRRAPAELAELGIQDLYWQPVGRDTEMEQILLAAIVRRSINMPGDSDSRITPAVDLTNPPPTEGL